MANEQSEPAKKGSTIEEETSMAELEGRRRN